jgi:ribosomal protein S15P/S13E
MSRIHSGHKGRAGSHRPYPLTKPEWVTATSEEVVEQVVTLAKGGLSTAQIGLTILSEHGVRPEIPDDLQALLKRVVHLQRHLTTHPKDLSNQRGLALMESRIRRLARYYRQHRRLPENWRYSAAGAALQVE